jgi:hypothetical protein
MNTKQHKALEAAKEALIGHGAECKDVNDALALIDEALAAPAQEPVAYRQTGWAAHRDQYAVPVLFNPYTGQPRDVRDVQSDPQGILIVPPGKIEMLAAKPTHQQSLQVATPPAAQPATEKSSAVQPAPVQEPVAWPIDSQHAERIAADQCVSYEVVQLIAREILATPPAAQRAAPLTADDVRKAGGIVHGDGNIFFTSIDQLNTAHGIKGASA